MIITRDIHSGYLIWDLPDKVEPWEFPSPYDDNTFICWKVTCNEFYSYCQLLTDEQIRLLGIGNLKNGEQKRVSISKQELIKFNIPVSFMSENYYDWPDRQPKISELER